MIAEGPAAKRPPHIALELLLLSSRSLKIAVLGLAVVLAGCDRQSSAPAQGEASTAATASSQAEADGGTIDRSHKGSELPQMLLRDAAGKELQLASLKGKPLLVNLWATWCAPCIAELPTLGHLASGGKIKVLTVSQDLKQTDKVAAFLAQRGVTRLEAWLDPENDLSMHYGVQTLPTTIYYDAAGRELWRVSGPMEWTGPEAAKLLAEAETGGR